MNRFLTCSILVAAFAGAGARASADDAAAQPTPTRHQMMKECMAKQKASDGGMRKEDMKKTCKDVTKTENENAKVEKKSAADTPSLPNP